MAIKTMALDFKGLAHIDEGRVDKLLRFHLQRCQQDCQNRPNDNNARKVTLSFVMKPLVNPSTGDCEKVSIEIEAKSSVPTYRTMPYQMLCKGELVAVQRGFSWRIRPTVALCGGWPG